MEAQERNPTNAGTANTPQIQKTLFVLRYNPPFSFVLYCGTGPELSTSDHSLTRRVQYNLRRMKVNIAKQQQIDTSMSCLPQICGAH